MKFEIEKGNFTTTFNDIFRAEIDEKKLTPEAWGIYIFMLSLPDDWDFSVGGLTAVINAGKNKINRVLIELEKAGFLIREQTKDDTGKFGKNSYTLLRKLNDSPLPQKPLTDKPLADFEPQQSTNKLNTNITNIYTNESINIHNDTIVQQENEITLSLIETKIKNLTLKKINPKTFFHYYEFENWKTKNGSNITIENLDSLLVVWDSREYDNSKTKTSDNKTVNKPEWIDRYMDELDNIKAVNEL